LKVAVVTRPALEVIEEAATVLAKSKPTLAAELRAIRIPGKKKAEGHTAHNLKLADLWCAIDDRVAAGEREADVLADLDGNNELGLNYDQLGRLWDLEGHNKTVRPILKERGRI